MTTLLDGWGPLGYAKLIMIEQLMHRIRIEEGLEEPPRPCDRFDIIGGSGMGGFVMIFLFISLLTKCFQYYRYTTGKTEDENTRC